MDVIDAIIKCMFGAPLFLRRVASGVVARNECVCGLIISHRKCAADLRESSVS